MDILKICHDLMQNGPPFFLKAGVRALLPPQKNPGSFRLEGNLSVGELMSCLFVCHFLSCCLLICNLSCLHVDVRCPAYNVFCCRPFLSIHVLTSFLPVYYCVVMSCLHVCQSVLCVPVRLYSSPVCLSSVWCPVFLSACMTSCLHLYLFEDMLTCLVVWFPDPLLLL